MELTQIKKMVKMRRGSKTYWESITNQQSVLKEMDLTVQTGTIYGLLGPSGCGKTTLLKCILGRLKLDSGTLEVFGQTPGSKNSCVPGPAVGYMPQDLALFDELSVEETWNYFGGICGMNSAAIKSRSQFLQGFLNLPSLKKLSSKLSGGQRRRVSFGIALLHEPKFLILDEPTVGVDPILRKSIWDHLESLVKDNATVIITTHYIEEARTCNKVGFMLNGRLLGEEQPEKLMAKNACQTLEDVFLKLCIRQIDKDTDDDPIINPEEIKRRMNRRKSSVRFFEDDSLIEGAANGESTESSLHNGAINGNSHGNGKSSEKIETKIDFPSVVIPARLRQKKLSVDYRRHQQLTRLQTYTSFFKSVVDKERISNWFRLPCYYRLYSILIKSTLRSYRAPGAMLFQFLLPALIIMLVCIAIGRPIKGIGMGIVNEDNLDFGDLFLSYIDDSVIKKIPYDSYEVAYQDALDGHLWGVMRIGQNYTDCLLSRLLQGALVDESYIHQSNINISMDLINPFISFTVTRELFYSFQSFLGSVVKRQGFSDKVTDFPIAYTDHVYGSIEENFTEFVIPGITIFIVYFISMGCTSLSLTMQKLGGLLDRSYVSGVTSTELILGEVFANFWTVAAQTFSTLVIGLAVFQTTCQGSIMTVVALTLLQGVCGVSCGVFISALFDQEMTVIMGCLGVLFPSLILTGAVWPMEGMAPAIRLLAIFFPQTYAVEALRSIMFRGWGLTYFPVYMAFSVTSGWLIVFLFLASVVFQLRE